MKFIPIIAVLAIAIMTIVHFALNRHTYSSRDRTLLPLLYAMSIVFLVGVGVHSYWHILFYLQITFFKTLRFTDHVGKMTWSLGPPSLRKKPRRFIMIHDGLALLFVLSTKWFIALSQAIEQYGGRVIP